MDEFTYEVRSPDSFPDWSFTNLDLEYEADSQSVWMYYKADGPPFYTFQTLIDMAGVRESLRALFASPYIEQYPIRYFVMASKKPGVFNLGGDLANFAEAIREGKRDWLRMYAHACIDVVHGMAMAYDLPIVTLSVITGQALGGGMEAALALDYLLADETARIGVPEVAFNTFPGMGAVSLLSRRVGAVEAEQIIVSGHVYSGREMRELEVVDMTAPAGMAHAQARAWMLDGGKDRFTRRLGIAAARRRLFPVSYEELLKITNLWVECSCDVTPHDIRHMERLASAQKRMTAAG